MSVVSQQLIYWEREGRKMEKYNLEQSYSRNEDAFLSWKIISTELFEFGKKRLVQAMMTFHWNMKLPEVVLPFVQQPNKVESEDIILK